jgi:Na+-translocating ferredoxin:NAD+ oxidoreductase RnfC subunit
LPIRRWNQQNCAKSCFRDGKCCQIKPYYFDPATIHAAVAAKARVQAQ